MIHQDDEVLYFRYCRNVEGRLVPIDTAKQNGRVVPCFSPDQFEPECESADSELDELISEVCQNLTNIERRTWLQLIDGLTILDIAAAEGITRAAIYERIRGNSKKHGGMISKNLYVAIWWRLRQAPKTRQ